MRRALSPFYYGTTDPDFAAFLAVLYTRGSTIKTSSASALLGLIKGLKADGTAPDLLLPMIGNNLAGATTYIRFGCGAGSGLGFNFLSGDYTESTGMQGDSISKYVETNVLTTSLTGIQASSNHIAVYNRSTTNTGGFGQVISGGWTSFTSELDMWAPYTDNNVYGSNLDANDYTFAAIVNHPYGFLMTSRTSLTDDRFYQAGVQIGSTVTATSGTLSVPVGTTVQMFTSTSYTPNPGFCGYLLAGGQLGRGYTPAEAAAVSARWQTYSTLLGRNV